MNAVFCRSCAFCIALTWWCLATAALDGQTWERWLQAPPQTSGGFRRQPVSDPPPRGALLQYRFEGRSSTLPKWIDQLDQERAIQDELQRSQTTDPNQPPALSEVSAINEQLLDAAIQDNAPWNATFGYRLVPALSEAVNQTQAKSIQQRMMLEDPPPASAPVYIPVASIPAAPVRSYTIAQPQVTIIPASIAEKLASYPELASQALGIATPSLPTP